ncbi:BPTI/Kunitz domain-containing protein-like [Battus philenor]|uniref:BPTI/Kunitz domain-containing protein-like n=1 Tax=Battus philenor TaxID=42288 RepID=UPI0035CFD236
MLYFCTGISNMRFYIILFLSIANDVFAQVTFGKEPYTRATPYRAKVSLKMCLLKPDPGPCRGDIAMYYFKPETMDCVRFSWGGCQGNGNRFDTKKECLDSCLSHPKSHNVRPPWCSLTFDYGFCFGAVKRWYFDAQWKVCKETIYSGCGGNKNNFYNLAQCDSICRFNKGTIREKAEVFGDPKKVLIINPPNASTAKAQK